VKELTLCRYDRAVSATDAEIFAMYWAQPDRPTKRKPYRYSVAEIAAQYGLTRGQVAATAAHVGFAYEAGRRCRRCGEHSCMDARTDFDRLLHAARDAECIHCINGRTNPLLAK
jgi:hypothetical protein